MRCFRARWCNLPPPPVDFLFIDDRSAGGSLYQHLRHGGKKYRRRSEKSAGVRCIPNRVGIEERPAEVEAKLRIGHWEGDTVIRAAAAPW
ncbi:MAG: hypothetical protein LBJ45_01440 [Holosporaceae bacterium]|nr:hypothetical protein [Holosporaceae bacterium]